VHNTEPKKAIETWLVSACLMGKACRYDGECAKASVQSRIVRLKSRQDVKLVAVCPEELGGLSTPRLPASFNAGDGHDLLRESSSRLFDSEGKDVSDAFVLGAKRTLMIAQQTGAQRACLKERSPSCASSFVYSDEGLREGKGVTAALLSQSGIEVVSEETLEAYLDKESKSASCK